MIKVSKATMATIKRFPELYKRQAMQVIDTSAEWYDDAVAEGLRNRLHNLGVEYGRD